MRSRGSQKRGKKMSKEFDTKNYQWSHGNSPRGVGSWAFIPVEVVGETAISEDEMVWIHQSTYGEAKKQAVKMYPEVTVWEVAT
jgi:hypothetical protein